MFIRYIENYFADKEIKINDPRSKSLAFIQTAALEQSPSYLGRVFNQFPHEYEGYYPFQKEMIIAWVEQFNTLIKAITSKINSEGVLVVSDKNLHDNIQSWIENLIATACTEVLDDDGQLKQEIMKTLALQTIINEWKTDPVKSKNIDLQVLYSYCIQILMGSIIEHWQINANSDDHMMAGQLTQYSQSLFADSKTTDWTPFFLQQIEKYVQSKPSLNRCIAKLNKMPNDELETQLKQMMQESKSDVSIPDMTVSNPALWMERVDLWINIMNHFKVNNDLVRARAIHQLFNEQVKDVLDYVVLYHSVNKAVHYPLSPDTLQKYNECNAAFNPAPVSEPSIALPDVNMSALNKVMISLLQHFSMFAQSVSRSEQLKKAVQEETRTSENINKFGVGF